MYEARWFPCLVLLATHQIMAASDRVSLKEVIPLLQRRGVTEWEDLGLLLGFSDAAIKEISSIVGEVDMKRRVMVSKWLQSDLEATWSKLAKALLEMNPPYKVLAADIRRQYCPNVAEAATRHDSGQKASREPSGGKCKFEVVPKKVLCSHLKKD